MAFLSSKGLRLRNCSFSRCLVGNKGYRKYLRIERGSVTINFDKVKAEARFDGKWVLRTDTDLPPEQVALKYKELWLMERIFRDVKTILETRPVFHQRDDTIRGHVFCSFLALVLRKELERRLESSGHFFEWADIKQDLKALQEILTYSTKSWRPRTQGSLIIHHS